MTSPALPRSADVFVIGGGIIGISIALELRNRGAEVTLFERDTLFSHASSAAAGMLAAHDPHNPAQMLPLAEYSLSLYRSYLDRVERLAGEAVPFQTETTLQYSSNLPRVRLRESSLDPRQLGVALRAAAKEQICVLEHTIISNGEHGLRDASGNTLTAPAIVYATGAWSNILPCSLPVQPRKGQMLRVKLREESGLREVHRSEQVYVAPRTRGPQAGTALIGATVEDRGFDVSLSQEQLDVLRAEAVSLSPELAHLADAPMIEAWAGLRPSTPDDLPILGPLPPRLPGTQEFVATGHFRNGILLAPGTAAVIADLIEHRSTVVDLASFSPSRFAR